MKLVVRSGGQDTYGSELVTHSCRKAPGGHNGSHIFESGLWACPSPLGILDVKTLWPPLTSDQLWPSLMVLWTCSMPWGVASLNPSLGSS